MREVATGVWHWQSPHPERDPSADGLDWPEKSFSSYAIDDVERLLIFDPNALTSEI